MRVLVTGGAGFVGSNLVDRLLVEGHEVRVLDSFVTGRRENLVKSLAQIDLIEGDVRSSEIVHAATRGCQAVLHQAALPSVPRSIQDPLSSHTTNVVGTLNVLLAARDEGVKRVVFASSSSVYGANGALPKTEDLAPLPISPYAVSKLSAEGYCRAFAEVYGLETVALRYFNVFGPRQDPMSQYAAVIPAFVTATLEGGSPRVFGDGDQTRDFTYVDNVVEANLLALAADGVTGRTFNVASGKAISLNDVLDALRTATGAGFEAKYEPPRTGDVRHSWADVSRAKAELGYSPSIDFAEGLGRAVSFYERALAGREAAALTELKGNGLYAREAP
jgi:UDP-glucose 4-epimerase